MEDEAILDLFFARDENAITATSEKYGKGLSNLAYTITENRSDTEECVSDTYLTAWNKIPPTRPSYFYAFLSKITRFLAYGILDKRHAAKRSGIVVELTEELADTIPAPDGTENELGRLLDAFLRTLDTDTQLIFLRRYYWCDPVETIAFMTGRSPSGITSLLFRTRQKLRRYLEQEGYTI